ncbi:MAG: hypothetical protein AB1743_07390 [Actinomycetota bacterium]
MICHDAHASSNGNARMIADGLYNYETSVTGGNWVDPNGNGKIDDNGEKCMVCHPKETETSRNSIVMGIKIPPMPGAASWKNHNDFTAAQGCGCHIAHDPIPPSQESGGESSGGSPCGSCHGNILSAMQTNTSYHHYMASADAGYPTENPSGDNWQLQAATRKCLMCHVDHDIFRPDLNANGARAKNLRAEIQSSPSKADISSYIDTDFDNSLAGGGICLSCHSLATFSKTSNRKNDNSLTTPQIAKTNYNASAHNYVGPSGTSTFGKDSSTFRPNCVKCHNDTLPKDAYGTNTYQNSTFRFGMHDSAFRHMLTNNGTTAGGNGGAGASPVETTYNSLEENFCYICHSGGTSPGNDIYRQSMSARAKNVKDQFNKTYKHPINAYAGTHRGDEFASAPTGLTTNGWNSTVPRHVECGDCHNAHAAKSGDRTTKGSSTDGNKAEPAITGIWGIQVITWGSSPVFSKTQSITYEYELCFKCHSKYAWGSSGTPPSATWPNGNSDAVQSDPVVDFNPANPGYHPVAAVGKRTLPSTEPGRTYLPLTFVPPYNYNSLITCSDCHGDESWQPGSSTVAVGLHGSNNRYILKRYYNSSSGVWTSTFCYECHDYRVYGFHDTVTNSYTSPADPYMSYSRIDHPINAAMMNGTYNTYRLHSSDTSGPGCFSCHAANNGTVTSAKLGGIHGTTNTTLGTRLMNGVNMTGYSPPTVSTSKGSCSASANTSNGLSNCNKTHSAIAVGYANWDN